MVWPLGGNDALDFELEVTTLRRKLEGEDVLVNRLLNSRPKCLVDLDRGADDTAS